MFSNGNMGKLMKQAKEMQDKMMKAQKEIEEMEIDGDAGGGAVKVKLNGRKELLSINISNDLLSEDKDMLEDLIIASINQAQKKVDEISKNKLGSISGGLPGMPGF